MVGRYAEACRHEALRPRRHLRPTRPSLVWSAHLPSCDTKPPYHVAAVFVTRSPYTSPLPKTQGHFAERSCAACAPRVTISLARLGHESFTDVQPDSTWPGCVVLGRTHAVATVELYAGSSPPRGPDRLVSGYDESVRGRTQREKHAGRKLEETRMRRHGWLLCRTGSLRA